ncbi:hypothetical protein [Novosphingobium sp. 9U]|uniref:hypothetical protein n=1 Tax=Novosphingobium sp. 9U TaxID=2653158 RepID=UPI0012F28838|nr:hypothetical protein [Novosphingobium sp. 9U]VWX51045.1 conserved hypothetical protein [Novosphingobium sp. 9U]
MKPSPYVDRFDLDLILRDETLDPLNSPMRRAIAALSIGVSPEDAYYSTRELREAVSWVHEGETGGKARLARILSTGCDDYQRCIYYSLAGRGVVRMMDDLEWLEDKLLQRAQLTRRVFREKLATMPLINPYVSNKPDGPLVSAEADFVEGPSWYLDPDIVGPY